MDQELINQAEGALLDLNGVFYVDETLAPGAREAVAALRAANLPRLYLTNTTTRNLDSLYRMLRDLGLPAEKSEILSPPQAAVLYLRTLGKPRCHLLLREELKKDFAEFPVSHVNPDVVVIGDIGDRWNHAIMNQAFQMVMYGAKLVALHKGRFWQVDNELRLDIGAYVAGLEYAAGHEAIIIGKPSPDFFRMALQSLGTSAEKTVMFGDDIEMDVGGAQRVGMKGVLVKTGKYRPEQEVLSSVRPDGFLDSIGDLPRLLEGRGR